MTNINHHKSTHHSHHHHKGGANGTTTGQACAACKYQRRKCAPDCILAPYFPHDRQRQFLNAHKLFGVSNITKIIRKLDQPQKDEAMRTIIFQSDVRAHDPVGGCYRVIRELQRQIEICQAELNIVLHQLALCRAQTQQAASQNENRSQINNSNDRDDSSTFVEGNCDLVMNANARPPALCSYDPEPSVLDYSGNEHDNREPERSLDDQAYDIFAQVGHHDDDDHAVPLQEIDLWGMQNSGSASLEVKQPSSSVHDECEDLKRLLLTDLDIPIEEQHSFGFEFEETIQPPCSSDEIVFHDETSLIKQENGSFQHNHQDHDLKGAATLFSLTNCTS